VSEPHWSFVLLENHKLRCDPCGEGLPCETGAALQRTADDTREILAKAAQRRTALNQVSGEHL
jgi:hypothetical protein